IRGATAVVAALTAVFVVVPSALAVYLVHKPRGGLGHPQLGAAYSDVSFRARDGLTIRGWYVPPRNGAALVPVHRSRHDPPDPAPMLVRHGYGALLIDARGRGESDGDNGSYGWRWDRDIRGAVDYLSAHGVSRIGVYGLSAGAEAALQSAAEDTRIDAVVADG